MGYSFSTGEIVGIVVAVCLLLGGIAVVATRKMKQGRYPSRLRKGLKQVSNGEREMVLDSVHEHGLPSSR